MSTALLLVNVVLGVLVLLLAFLVLGTLRALGLLTWRVEQLETITPSRLGRDGIRVGKKAPHFTLPSAAAGEASLRDFAGRKVLLVFTQSGCGPCRQIIPELNRVHDKGECDVVVVNNGAPEETRQWAAEVKARFQVLAQEKYSLSKRYEVFATPFAFLIDEQGIVTSKGIVGTRQYLHYVLTGAGSHAKYQLPESERDPGEKNQNVEILPSQSSTEVIDV
jgi:methylamine dehydrogenase accessory protein MauD